MDWLAGIIELAAKILVGNHKWYGHALHLVAGIAWTYVSLTTGMYGLLVITIPAFVINIRNAIKWWKEKNERQVHLQPRW